jgi:endonuclease/exonuclease/phosphatase family metal-dependent hydrolase
MTELTVMSWNVQNLLPVGAEGGPTSSDAYRAKLAAVSAVIAGVAPDVLALQEVGGDDVLADLDAACGHVFPYRTSGTPDDRGIRVALLSAMTLRDRRETIDFPPGVLPVQWRDTSFDPPTTSKCRRGILAATVGDGDVSVTAVTCHLKSKLISYQRAAGDPDATAFTPRDEGERLRYAGYAIGQRAAEAMAVRQVLDELLTAPGRDAGDGDGTGRENRVVACGDFNDEPHAATTQIVQGPGGSEIDLAARSGFQRTDRGDGWRMWNLAPLLAAPAFSRVYRGRGELIDHVFASHRLVNPANLPRIAVVGTATLPSMTDTPTPMMPSDHAAVIATFTL